MRIKKLVINKLAGAKKPKLKETAPTGKYQRVSALWRKFQELNSRTWTEQSKQSNVEKVAQERGILYLFDQLQMQKILFIYQFRGHLGAALDPLNLRRAEFTGPSLELPQHEVEGIKSVPLDKSKRIFIPSTTYIGGVGEATTVGEMIHRLNEAYCGRIGFEYGHLFDGEEVYWTRKAAETGAGEAVPPAAKRAALLHLIQATAFESFLNSRLPTSTRQRAEGFEMIVPLLQLVFDRASEMGADSFVVGMNTPRSRLNILANVLRMPLSHLFQPFEGDHSYSYKRIEEQDRFTMGAFVKKVSSGTIQSMEFSMLGAVPEGESIDPIVYGKVKAQQVKLGDLTGSRVWPTIIHSGESLRSQGVSYQSLMLARSQDFSVGGTIHIVLTNQNELPRTMYDHESPGMSTNVGYVINAPVFHVNGSHPDSVIRVVKIATEFRKKFRRDVFINLIGYERQHPDDKRLPMETTKAIEEMPSIMNRYAVQLEMEEVATQDEIEGWKTEYLDTLESRFDRGQRLEFNLSAWLDSPWKKFYQGDKKLEKPLSGLTEGEYKDLMDAFDKYEPFIEAKEEFRSSWIERIKMAKTGSINWYMAESLLFAHFLQNDKHIRLSGEDVEDCLHFKRHHVLHSTDNIQTRLPLEDITQRKGKLTVAATSHAEASALGFSVGFAQANPHNVVIWESSPGDTLPYAQSIFDIFIANGEARWARQCGVICILQHGIQGDPFVNAWPESLLQLSSDEGPHDGDMDDRLRKANWAVVVPTTAANLFHAISRSQVARFRKPLILFTHRLVADNPLSSSPVSDFIQPAEFQTFISDTTPRSSTEVVMKVLLCTGKVYFELAEARARLGLTEKVAICRLEQIVPFPFDEVTNGVAAFPKASQIVWAQEEYKNQGWWFFVERRLKRVFPKRKVGYAGRPTAPLICYPEKTNSAQEKFLKQAFEY